MPVITLNDIFMTRSVQTAVTLDQCRQIIRDSEGQTVTGATQPSHPLMHVLNGGNYAHLSKPYLDRTDHSMFGGIDDAAIALQTLILSPAGAFALSKLRSGRIRRVQVAAGAAQNSTMRSLTASNAASPIRTTDAVCAYGIFEVESSNGRLNAQSLYPMESVSRILAQDDQISGPSITSAAIVKDQIYKFCGPVMMGQIVDKQTKIPTLDTLGDSKQLRQKWGK